SGRYLSTGRDRKRESRQSQKQPAGRRQGFGGVSLHNHCQPPTEMGYVADAACRHGQGGSSPRHESNSFQECVGVGPSFTRRGRDDPRVATLFLGFPQFTPRPPGNRMPPIEGDDKQFHEAHPMTAAANMSQLMKQKRGPLLSVQAVEEARRE